VLASGRAFVILFAMTKTILICGYGKGISAGVASRFGAAGFAVGLVARSIDKLAAAVKTLSAAGVRAVPLPCDLGDPAAVTAMVAQARRDLGPVTVLHWNAYSSTAGDLTTAKIETVRAALDVGITGCIAAVQAALPDLQMQQGQSAVLFTGGGLSFYGPRVDALATQWGVMGLAVVKAAQHKLAGLYAEKLREHGIYVGEVVVTGIVKGTEFDTGSGTLEPAAIAEKFFGLYTARAPLSVNI
jgi:NADP-dependent 3-hydroxy acid dehydrogenase YdfG